MLKKYFILSLIIFLTNCTKEYVVDVKSNPPEGGDVFPSQGTYKEGSSVILNASPKGEYLFDSWSGDATGQNRSIEVLVDDNKNITANFVLKKYELNIEIDGKGEVREQIIETGKGTEYVSGTTIRLEAIPSYGYYFSGWSFDITSDTNPIEVTIDRPKTIKATFKKLSYELRVLKQGEGEVEEEIINTSKSTDYEYETTVRLTATPSEGSDFIEWEESGATTELNPFDIVITEPKTITAVFEYDLFNLSVGKWKIKKRKQSQKSLVYDVYSIIFNRNRSFRLNYSSGQISGTYSVTSNSNITLNNYGSLSNVLINQGQISFNLNITGLFQFDVEGERVENYQPNKTFIPDQNFEQALIDGGYDTTVDSYIDDSSMLGVTQLDLSNRQITEFTGLEEFVNLTDLNLSGNTITSVPLVNLNQLTTLNLSNTGLTELDLSQNSNISSLDLSGNTGLSCVKVSQQIYQQVPSQWIYDSTTSFELECDCPTLSIVSGNPNQSICEGEEMEDIIFEFGGTDVDVRIENMPTGIQSNLSSSTLTISGTPLFLNDTYEVSISTTGGKENCNQVSKTINLNKNLDSPLLTLISGNFVQTIDQGESITPIVVSYGGSTTSLTISGPDFNNISQLENTVTIAGSITSAGTYNGSITTISNGGCEEITQSIQITVNAPVVISSGGGGNNTNSNESTSETNTSTSTVSESTNETSSEGVTSSSCEDTNTYSSVVIGGQEWFSVPLQTTCFQNGDELLLIEDETTWSTTSNPGYVIKNGFYLYNGYAVQDSRNICPNGFRVPNSNDWRTLFDYVQGNNSKTQLGIDLISGGSSGFNAQENTYRGKRGEYYESQPLNYYQSSNSNEFVIIGNINPENPFTQVNNYNSNQNNAGYCVRCIKN